MSSTKTKIIIERHMDRPDVADSLTMPEFYTRYVRVYDDQTRRQIFRGQDGSRWALRTGIRALWRTQFLNPSSGEVYY